MLATIIWISLFGLLGSVGAVLLAAVFLVIPEKLQRVLVPCLVSYATGTLLTAALLGLIPHAVGHASSLLSVSSTVLIGIVLFFLLEKMIIWRHCHDRECVPHGTAGPLILIGDIFHNAVDGVVIASSFLSSVPVGIVVSLSVIAHEIPQELGDIAILLDSGYSKRKALLFDILSSLSTLLTAILAYYALEVVHAAIPYVMAISAAGFLYIALVDLYPELHRQIGLQYAVRQFLLMLFGIGTIIILLQFHS